MGMDTLSTAETPPWGVGGPGCLEESREPVVTAWRIFSPSDNSELLSGRAVPPSPLSVRTCVPSAVKQLAENSQGVQSGTDVLVFLYILHFYGARGEGAALAFFTQPGRTRTRATLKTFATGAELESQWLRPRFSTPALSGPSHVRSRPRVGVAVLLRDSQGRGRGGSAAAVAGRSSQAGEARGEASHPEAVPHRIKQQTHRVPPAAAPAGRRGGEAAPMLQSGHGRPALVGPPAGWQLGGGLV